MPQGVEVGKIPALAVLGKQSEGNSHESAVSWRTVTHLSPGFRWRFRVSLQGLVGHLSPGAAQLVPRLGATDVHMAQGEGTQGGLWTLGSRLLLHLLFPSTCCAPGTVLGTVKQEQFLLSWNSPSCGEIKTPHTEANALRSLFQSGKCYEDSKAGRCIGERLGVMLDRNVRCEASTMGRPGEPDAGSRITSTKPQGGDSCGPFDAHNNGQCPWSLVNLWLLSDLSLACYRPNGSVHSESHLLEAGSEGVSRNALETSTNH